MNRIHLRKRQLTRKGAAMKLTRTDLGDLNFFRVVAETGGFRKTAA